MATSLSRLGRPALVLLGQPSSLVGTSEQVILCVGSGGRQGAQARGFAGRAGGLKRLLKSRKPGTVWQTGIGKRMEL